MHRAFISYYHANDQHYKEELVRAADQYGIFQDCSVDTDDIDESLDDQTIREKIRDEYLKNSTVTILLVGKETKNRKHVDWELRSSMFDGRKNKKSGVLVINLPSVENDHFHAGHGDIEKQRLYPNISSWMTIETKSEYEQRYPYMPARIIDNLFGKARISVVNWSKLAEDIDYLKLLVDLTSEDRAKCEYDLSRPMRGRNS